MIDYLCDSDWMVDYLNGNQNAVQLFSSLAEHGIAISIMTYAELYEGALGSPRREERLRQLQEVADSLDVIGIDFEVARRFAEIRRTLRQQGQAIPDPDALIAATALRHDLTLVSRDNHFSRVNDLKLRTG